MQGSGWRCWRSRDARQFPRAFLRRISVEMKVLKVPESLLPPPLTGPSREGDWLQDRIEVLRGGVRFQTQPWHVIGFKELHV